MKTLPFRTARLTLLAGIVAAGSLLACGQPQDTAPAPGGDAAAAPTSAPAGGSGQQSAPAPAVSQPAPAPRVSHTSSTPHFPKTPSSSGSSATGSSAYVPAPAPAPRVVTLNQGSSIPIRLTADIDSGTAKVGQVVTGEVTQDVSADGVIVVPAGSRVNGSVTLVQPAKHFGGQAAVTVQFASIDLPGGRTVPVEGTVSAAAKKQTGKDAATIAGSAVGGAILGKIIGHDGKDARTGALAGAAIGTAVASRKGDEALLATGTEATVTTKEAARAQGA
jgi:hypothetical protein